MELSSATSETKAHFASKTVIRRSKRLQYQGGRVFSSVSQKMYYLLPLIADMQACDRSPQNLA
jgi:hypothetical protein